MADLDHLAHFTVDLLDAHHRQFEVYREDKKETVHKELATLANLAYGLVEAQYRQQQAGRIDQTTAQEVARRALKRVQVGETGYIYAMTTRGDLAVHIAREGENVFDERDEDGHYFIRAMCQAAKTVAPGQVLTIIYPWRNPELDVQAAPEDGRLPLLRPLGLDHRRRRLSRRDLRGSGSRTPGLRRPQGAAQDQEGRADRLHLLHGPQGDPDHPPRSGRGEHLRRSRQRRHRLHPADVRTARRVDPLSLAKSGRSPTPRPRSSATCTSNPGTGSWPSAPTKTSSTAKPT